MTVFGTFRTLGIIGLALMPRLAFAGPATYSSPSYGVSWFVGPHGEVNPVEATLAQVRVGNGMMYVADLYGDGLISLRISNRVAAELLHGETAARIKMDLHVISDAVGSAALGTMASAVRFHAEANSLVLEEEEAAAHQAVTVTPLGSGETASDTEGGTDLSRFRHTWTQPTRIPNRRSRRKQTQAVAALRAAILPVVQ